MSKVIPDIDAAHRKWIEEQRVFFVASAPLSAEGHVNLSPRGGDCLRVLGPHEIMFRDLIGSGAETTAHLRENGRIVVMFCAFKGPPRILRCHGIGQTILPSDPQFADFNSRFEESSRGVRAFIHIDVKRISTSCGYGVPLYDYKEERPILDNYYNKQSAEELLQFQKDKNQTSIDGLAAFDL